MKKQHEKYEVMLIDGLNAFIRSYIVNPTIDSKGNPIGGCMGFLKSLQKVVRMFQPDEVVICWDGQGGSQRRKAQNKNYKAGRSPVRFNRRMYELSPEEQEKNKAYQYMRLLEYLNEMPVVQVVADNIEADDIIAILARSDHYAERSKIIISSDKDFFQLCDSETVIYRPIQDTITTEETIVEEFGIHPNNFALARAIAGDPSDNIAGIPRVGLGTMKKRFEFLKEPEAVSSQQLVEHCRAVGKKLSCHNKIISHSELVQSNYSIMQLYHPSMSPTTRSKIMYNVLQFSPEVNITTIKAMMIKDGIGSYRFDDLYAAFRRITA
jgi:DNA polymerase-1